MRGGRGGGRVSIMITVRVDVIWVAGEGCNDWVRNTPTRDRRARPEGRVTISGRVEL